MKAKVNVIFQISKVVEVEYNPTEHESPIEAFDEYDRDDCDLYSPDGHPDLKTFNTKIAPELQEDGWNIELWDTEAVSDCHHNIRGKKL